MRSPFALIPFSSNSADNLTSCSTKKIETIRQEIAQLSALQLPDDPVPASLLPCPLITEEKGPSAWACNGILAHLLRGLMWSLNNLPTPSPKGLSFSMKRAQAR